MKTLLYSPRMLPVVRWSASFALALLAISSANGQTSSRRTAPQPAPRPTQAAPAPQTPAARAPANESSNGGQDAEARLNAIKQAIVAPEYTLRYRFEPRESLRYKVTHQATVDTTIRGNEAGAQAVAAAREKAQSISVSTKIWKVERVDDDGNMTFVYSVEDVDMWQQTSGRQEIRYNSRTDTEIPPAYVEVSSALGKPLATITIDPLGTILERKSERSQFTMGMGDLLMPLPAEPIKAGHRWTTPHELIVRLPDSSVKRVKTQKLYELVKVEAGIATVQVRTQILTPVRDDPKIMSQLVHQLTNGTIKFDVEKGRVVHIQMDWDELVLGFQGQDSSMQYLARFTEELISDEQPDVARQPGAREEK